MVSTGSPKIATAAVPASRATIDPGNLGIHLGIKRMVPSEASALPRS
jgi:hypothetical protein